MMDGPDKWAYAPVDPICIYIYTFVYNSIHQSINQRTLSVRPFTGAPETFSIQVLIRAFWGVKSLEEENK